MTARSLFDLSGRVALITGAAGHLGRSMAFALAEAGAHVFLNGRTRASLASLRDDIERTGGQATVACFDVTDPEAVREGIAAIREKHGYLNVLVNNAYAGMAGTLENATEADYDRAYRVTVTAAHSLISRSIPLLVNGVERMGDASVINVSSMYGMVSPQPEVYESEGMNNPPYYGAAKAALLQLTRYAACHLGNRGIRVNAISPGPFPAPDVASGHPEFVARLAAKTPLRRIGSPDELKGALLFLASSASTYVTGANIPVDGGWTAW